MIQIRANSIFKIKVEIAHPAKGILVACKQARNKWISNSSSVFLLALWLAAHLLLKFFLFKKNIESRGMRTLFLSVGGNREK